MWFSCLWLRRSSAIWYEDRHATDYKSTAKRKAGRWAAFFQLFFNTWDSGVTRSGASRRESWSVACSLVSGTQGCRLSFRLGFNSWLCVKMLHKFRTSGENQHTHFSTASQFKFNMNARKSRPSVLSLIVLFFCQQLTKSFDLNAHFVSAFIHCTCYSRKMSKPLDKKLLRHEWIR